MQPARERDLTFADDDGAVGLARALGIRTLTARLLLRRNIATVEAARKFLEPRLADMRAPDAMAGFPRAVERIDRALAAGETIGVFGDYDVDGITTCALVTRFL